MTPLLLFILVILLKSVVVFLSSAIATHIPYLGFFPYHDEILLYHLPPVISSLANFDGIHYVTIAQKGYAQYTQAFFPLFPLMIRAVGWFIHNKLLAGVMISFICSGAAIIFWKKCIDGLFHDSVVTFWSMVFILAYPTAYFFNVVYTESLFFLIITIAFYNLQKHNGVAAGLAAALASFTRLAGLFLLIPFGVYVWFNRKKLSWGEMVWTCVSPSIGFFIYAVYLHITTGDALFFYHVQPAFGANRSTHIILLPQVLYRYLRIFLTAAPNFQYYVSVFEFVSFILVFAVLCVYFVYIMKKKHVASFPVDMGIWLFSMTNLIVPTLTGTFSAIPRYSLMSLSFFIALSRLIQSKIVKTILAIIFIAMQMVAFALFMQGYYIS